MPLIVAVWPNNTLSIVRMEKGFSMVDLYDQLDSEACPLDAACYLIGSRWDGLHATFDWHGDRDGLPAGPDSPALQLGLIAGRKRRLFWPPGIARMWARSLASRVVRAGERSPIGKMTAAEMATKPSEPTETYTVEEVRAMAPFAGVYFAFNDDGSCHYVGESENVPSRVTKGRPEIGARRIGLIETPKNERKLIEAYFVSMLNPAGNAISTHRMAGKSGGPSTRRGK
jgi:hypothetical protein